MQRLTLSFDTDDGLDGELKAIVESKDFKGKSAAWFSIHQLKAFSELLGSYPIVPGKEPILAGGFWKDDELDQPHVSIRIEAAGSQGKLLVKVALATPVWGSEPSDHHSVQAHFLVNYADLGVFQCDFSLLLDGKASEARLETTAT